MRKRTTGPSAPLTVTHESNAPTMISHDPEFRDLGYSPFLYGRTSFRAQSACPIRGRRIFLLKLSSPPDSWLHAAARENCTIHQQNK